LIDGRDERVIEHVVWAIHLRIRRENVSVHIVESESRRGSTKTHLYLFVELYNLASFFTEKNLFETAFFAWRRRPYQIRTVDESFRWNIVARVVTIDRGERVGKVDPRRDQRRTGRLRNTEIS
jgi:hypothetical protein